MASNGLKMKKSNGIDKQKVAARNKAARNKHNSIMRGLAKFEKDYKTRNTKNDERTFFSRKRS